MIVEEPSTIPQDQLAEVNHLVEESYNNPQNKDIQQLSLRSCLRFLSKLGDDAHVFCNPLLEKAALKSLVIFAYPDTHHLAAYQSFLSGQLAKCPQCPRKFHIALMDFEKIMLETFNYDQDTVDELMQSIERWNQSRIFHSLALTYEKVKLLPNPKPSDFQEELIPLFECLCAPRLLKDDSLHSMFKNVFFGIQSPRSPTIRPPDILPGVISFLFSSDPQDSIWAELTVTKIKASDASTAENFDAMLVQSVDDVVEEASNKQMSEEALKRFWHLFTILIRILDRSVFVERLSGRPHDIIRFLASCILKLPKGSLSTTLLAFGKTIEKIGPTIWTLITPVSVEYIVNAIRGNSFLSNPMAWTGDLNQDPSSDIKHDPRNVISWIMPLLKSCDSTSLQRCGQVIAPMLLDQMGTMKGKPEEELLIAEVLNVFSICLSIELRDAIPFVSQVQRLQRTPMKHLCYQFASQILDSYTRFKVTNIHIPGRALDVIYSSILLDVVTGTPDHPGLRDSTVSLDEEKSRDGLISLWTKLNTNMPQDPNIAIHILRGISAVPFIVRPPPRKPDEVHVMPRGDFSIHAVNNASSSMRIIGEFDSETLLPVLKDDQALLSIILNLYSVDQEVNQSAVDILCQAFDADDRLSALSAMLNFNLKRSLTLLTTAIKKVNDVYIFSPYPKLIKVAQDVSQCLFGAKAGVLNKKNDLSPGSDHELLKYWQMTWKFLEKIFKTTPKWAVYFKNDFMLEFMRDLLDYSRELVDYYRLLESLMPADIDTSTSNNYLLLNPVIDCLTEMCRLLRLRDEALILSCFNIIISVLELMKSFDVKPSRALVQIFTQLASRSRGFENVLTADQSTQLLVDSGAFTVEEAARAMRRSATPGESEGNTSTPDVEVVEVRSQPATKKLGQRSIMDFARPGSQAVLGKPISSVVQPQAVSGSAARTSMMETLRAEVKSSRGVSKPQPVPKDIHPARPPGFNSNSKFGRKAAADSKTVDSSDEESSDDNSDGDGLFTVKKVLGTHKLRNIEKKAVGTINVNNTRRKIGQETISTKEREERNMRARLQIDMNPLYKQILSWDYHANTDTPKVLRTGQPFSSTTQQVPDTFESVAEYQAVFEPLLMLECWQGIQRTKMEAIDKPFKITLANKTLVGNGAYEIRASVASTYMRDSKIGDSDLLVLSYFSTETTKAEYPSPDVPYCFAKIKEIKNTNSDYIELALRVEDPPLNMHNRLTLSTELHVLRTASLTTIEREYCSLKGLPYYDLNKEILNAIPCDAMEPSPERVTKTVSTYNVNESQAKAIISSRCSDGFSLIQGPPGTGKTKTILGIVGSFLTESKLGRPITQPSATAMKAANDLKEDSLSDMKRVLICAPSNAAVDELVLRLKGGIIGANKELIHPVIVRLGRSDVINSNVRELTLEELVDKRLEAIEKEATDKFDGSLRSEQNENLAKRDELRQKQNVTADGEEREAIRLEIMSLTKKIKETGHKLDLQREQLQVKARKRDIERRKAQTLIMRQAQVICATLSGSAHSVLSSLQMRFDTVIIDEAAQCIELSALIPLKYGCKQCIMVGDPNQLPPTVLSQHAASLKYEQSLFVRMFNKYPNRVHMLNVQFRMHPDIAAFPSREFYDKKLTNGSTNLERTKRDWHNSRIFTPYRFFDVQGSHEKSQRTKSLFNKAEAQTAFQLYNALQQALGHEAIAGKVGIISPYKQQVVLLKKVFQSQLGDLAVKDIDFNTIDGFQGQEKDIIMISCVRAEPDAHGVGFLSDTRRMNVAITRAKSALWILGNEKSLVKNPVWNRLLHDAKSRQMFTVCSPGFLNNPFTIPPTNNKRKVMRYSESQNKYSEGLNYDDGKSSENTSQVYDNNSHGKRKYPESYSSDSKRFKGGRNDDYNRDKNQNSYRNQKNKGNGNNNNARFNDNRESYHKPRNYDSYPQPNEPQQHQPYHNNSAPNPSKHSVIPTKPRSAGSNFPFKNNTQHSQPKNNDTRKFSIPENRGYNNTHPNQPNVATPLPNIGNVQIPAGPSNMNSEVNKSENPNTHPQVSNVPNNVPTGPRSHIPTGPQNNGTRPPPKYPKGSRKPKKTSIFVPSKRPGAPKR